MVPVHPEDLLRVDRLVSCAGTGIWGGSWLRVPPLHHLSSSHIASLPPHMASLPPQDCSNAWCQELSCALGRLERGSEVSVHVLRAVHNDFFRAVRGWDPPPGWDPPLNSSRGDKV